MNYSKQNYPIQTDPTWDIVDSSKMQDAMTCWRLFFFKHLAGLRGEGNSIHLEFGTAWHLAMEYLVLNNYSAESVESAMLLLEEHYRKFYPSELDGMLSPKNPARARAALQDYTGRYRDDLERYEVMYTEVGGSVSVGHDHRISFRMDTVLRETETNLIYSLDHKTGSQLNDQWRKKWKFAKQCGCYNHALNCEFGVANVGGMIMNGTFFRKVKDDSKAERHEFERVSACFSKAEMGLWLREVQNWFRQLELQLEILSQDTVAGGMSAFPRSEQRCCDWGRTCEFWDFCAMWTNPLRQLSEGIVPLGFKREFWNPLAEKTNKTIEA